MLQIRLITCTTAAGESDMHVQSHWSASEMQRWDTLTTTSQRVRFTAARKLLRSLLIQRWGGQPSDWPLTAEAGQPPTVPGRHDCHLSLSHSGPYLLAALGDAPIGVDIEAHGRRRPVQAMAEKVCLPKEREHLTRLPIAQAQHTFLRYWTRKEAWLKARGLGLDIGLMARLQYQEAPMVTANIVSWQSDQLTLSVCGKQFATLQTDWDPSFLPVCLGYGILNSL